MAWRIEVGAKAAKELGKLGDNAAKRIAKSMRVVAALDDPRLRGEALTGNLAGLWRYRVGDWRVIVSFDDGRMIILVIEVGHRREVYR